ncbi:MAG TPA: phenylalanine--tRNA ligase subunit alpha [Gemmatimonadaceae bacterium]|nr:phenylalanine--tRNA ligase subunit alpha [Gemmatimonadaceae bacterium]
MPVALSHFLDQVAQVERAGVAALAAAGSAEALLAARTTFLGRKSGQLTDLMKQLPALAPEERRDAGAAVNRAKQALESLADERERALAATPVGPTLDLTLPARPLWRGSRHPVTLVIEEIAEVFRELGFTIALGPEAETEWYNFGALNFPPDHPAMDLHDTLYLGDETLLRTHTSPVQIRTLQRFAPPVRVLVPGNVYRRDFFDPSHAPAFAQIEGLVVDEGIGLVDLKATLTHFARRFFGAARTRFRPSYFPFTEPSAEMDVECRLCGGRGCSACKQSGWMEILGSGMVHPNVLRAAGVDPERYTGWAFGMGPGRIAMQRYDIPDIRILYDSDIRFLQQVAE